MIQNPGLILTDIPKLRANGIFQTVVVYLANKQVVHKPTSHIQSYSIFDRWLMESLIIKFFSCVSKGSTLNWKWKLEIVAQNSLCCAVAGILKMSENYTNHQGSFALSVKWNSLMQWWWCNSKWWQLGMCRFYWNGWWWSFLPQSSYPCVSSWPMIAPIPP